MPPPAAPAGSLRSSLRSERGLTLIELALVGALATLVMLGLTGFYLNSQRLWIEGSTKSMTQRDAALLMDVVGRAVHRAAKAQVDQITDPDHHRLSLFTKGNVLLEEFAVDGGDGRVHRFDDAGTDLGQVVDSQALRLHFDTVDSTLVELSIAELMSASGDTVRIATRYGLMGRGL